MGLLKISSWLISLLLMGCGVHYAKVLQAPVARTIAQTSSDFSIRVKSTTEQMLLLNSANLLRPTIIIFAQDTCDVCGEETEMLLSHLEQEQPLKVDIYTILLGATLDDAQWWQELFAVTWPVGIDFTGKYFKRYCKENTVPCLIIYRPGEGIVFSQHGKVSFATITDYTGPWY